MAVLALTVAGQALGGYIGASVGAAALGASIGGAIGMAVGNALFNKPPDTQGPRLSSLDTAVTGEGASIPLMWGSIRVPGHIIWAPKLTERSRKTDVGGKGSSPTHESFYATGSWAVSFGYNRDDVPRKVRRIWANKELVYDATEGDGVVIKKGFAFTFHDGTQTTPDPTMEGIIGEGNVPAYTGQALLVFEDLNLEAFGNPSFSHLFSST